MIRFGFTQDKVRLLEIEVHFNQLLNKYYPDILEYGPYQLYKACPEVSVQEWKEFRLEKNVDQWYQDEMELLIKTKVMKMLNKAGDDHSTGVAQTLAQTLNYLEKNKDRSVEPTVYIYSFIPLTPEEEKAPNVRTIKNIPPEIDNAIIRNKRN